MLSHRGTQTIETDRLILRKFTMEDAPDMYKNWANDSEVTRFLSWKPHENVEATREKLSEWISEYVEESKYSWVIELKEIGEAIAHISIVHMDEKHLACEIGYCTSRAYWGKGLTSEALKAVIDYLFSQVGFNRIAALHDPVNAASGKVMLNAGMQHEGTLRQIKRRNSGPFYDLAVYSILKEDWLKHNNLG